MLDLALEQFNLGQAQVKEAEDAGVEVEFGVSEEGSDAGEGLAAAADRGVAISTSRHQRVSFALPDVMADLTELLVSYIIYAISSYGKIFSLELLVLLQIDQNTTGQSRSMNRALPGLGKEVE